MTKKTPRIEVKLVCVKNVGYAQYTCRTFVKTVCNLVEQGGNSVLGLPSGEEKDIYQRLASIESKAETTAPYRVFPFGKGTMPSFSE